MKYLISKILSNYKDKITILESDFNDLKKAKNILLAGLAIEEKYDLLVANYEDLEKEIVSATIESMLRPPGNYADQRCIRARFNKRLIHLLTASRLYLDHTKQHLCDILPNKSDCKKKVQELSNDKSNKHLDYELMNYLRDHVLHRDFVVHYNSFSIKVVTDPDTEKRISFTMDLGTVKKVLKKGRSSEKNKFFVNLGEKIDLKKATRKYVHNPELSDHRFRF